MKKKNNNRGFLCCRFSLGMKMTVVFMLVAQIAFSGENARAQQNISIRFMKSSLTEVLRVLKEKTNYEFLYNDEEVKNIKGITHDFQDASVEEILTTCLADTRYDYKIVNNLIVITPKIQLTGQQPQRIMVKGKVKDENGEPLPGATIVIKGVKVGVATDIDGLFGIEIPSSDVILVVSFVGMETQEVLLKNIKDLKQVLDIRMKRDATEMDEVVVTGYGNIRKESFTGSSVTVSQEDLLKVSQTNVISALQTFDPSFRIQTNNQWGSDPNALPEMYIRGRSGIGIKELDKDALSKSNLENNPNLPTFIMDGFEVSVQKVYDMDPTRIASMTILKDAAATAMYGSRAANGVVVITTVAPKPGEVRVSYNFNGSVTMPDLSDYNLANASEKLEIERLSGIYDPTAPNELQEMLDQYYRRYRLIQQGVNTNWLSIPLRTAFNHKHSLYVEGGTEDLRYGLDASYNKGDGVMKDSYRDRTGVGFFIDYRYKKFQVRNYISYNYTKAQESPYGSFSDYAKILPYDSPYDMDGNLRKLLKHTQDNNKSMNNPLYEALLDNFDYDKIDEFIDNVSLNWYINNYLSVKGQFSMTKRYTKGEKFIDPLSTKSTVKEANEDSSLTGDLYTDKGETTDWETQAFLYYQRAVSRHNINLSVGMNAVGGNSEATSAHYRGFPSGKLSSPNYAAEIYQKPIKTQEISRLISFLGSLNYTWDDIYLLDASIRFDGSSKFGRNNKFAPFWSGGVGLNIHNYEFLKGNKWVNQLKVKASYGQTGKVEFPPYTARTTYESLFDEWYITGFGSKLKALGNPDLSWEKTNKLNIGLDLQFFDQRLTLNAEWYNDKTVDLINDVTIPTSSGFASYKNNMGEVKNTGFQLILRADVIRSRDFSLALWGNMAHNKNKILKISESLRDYNNKVDDYYADKESHYTDPKYAKPIPKYDEGGSLTAIYGMKSLGIDPVTGQELLVNRDGAVTTTWSASQEVIIGDSEPKIQGAFGFNLVYKQFSVFASFMYETGGQLYNETLVNDVENADVQYRNVDKRVLTDRWKKPGDVTPLKDIKDRRVVTSPTSRFIQDNRVLSLNALTFSYDFKTDLIRKLGLSVLRLEASTNDIVRFSSIRQERGTSYPYARTVNFSVKVNF